MWCEARRRSGVHLLASPPQSRERRRARAIPPLCPPLDKSSSGRADRAERSPTACSLHGSQSAGLTRCLADGSCTTSGGKPTSRTSWGQAGGQQVSPEAQGRHREEGELAGRCRPRDRRVDPASRTSALTSRESRRPSGGTGVPTGPSTLACCIQDCAYTGWMWLRVNGIERAPTTRPDPMRSREQRDGSLLTADDSRVPSVRRKPRCVRCQARSTSSPPFSSR